jgi:hypothetical protein
VGAHHPAGGRGDEWLSIAEVAGQLGRVADPGAVLAVDEDPVDGEAVDGQQLAVEGGQRAAMVGGIGAATLVGHPDAPTDRRPDHDRGAPRLDASDEPAEGELRTRWRAAGGDDAHWSGKHRPIAACRLRDLGAYAG